MKFKSRRSVFSTCSVRDYKLSRSKCLAALIFQKAVVTAVIALLKRRVIP